MNRAFKRELSYSDISLLPKKCVVASRKECDTSFVLGDYRFEMPVFPANMPSVVDDLTCGYLADQGWFYINHRFGRTPISFVLNMTETDLIASISTGVSLQSEVELSDIYLAGGIPHFITIDIAHAWSEKVKSTIGFIKKKFPKAFVIAGNVCTAEAVQELESWGADAIKVGIAGGAACTTKNKTGFHRPMVSAILECASVAKVPIIADGGIKEHGDIAKALACGATAVMAGMLFSGYDESAGDKVSVNGGIFKEYYGSASERVKGARKNVEGTQILVSYKGPMGPLLTELKEDLQSSISYAGGSDLSALRNCEIVTHS
jgi:GMP reductase